MAASEIIDDVIKERDELRKRVGALKTLGDVEDEIICLRKQVDELQAANTRLLEERRAVDIHYCVEHFKHLVGHPMRETPGAPPDERVRFCAGLICEEFLELMQALFGEIEDGDDLFETQVCLTRLLHYGKLKIDLPEFADACQDLKYVVVGAELEFGIDGRPIFRAVHESNMAKVGGPKRDDSKQGKPEGWVAPDIEGELRKQGWRG